ncbi:MAG TPA: maleylpyruvate isomerase family mycothiol-dependent enzyme [Acidimicrobiales bacterium]|nr:maleylpyruvate isomerase family mycothiol-dependent enzyme [Acidimicrobiales bacterium]
MPTLVDRSHTVELLRNEFAALSALCSALSDDQWDLPTCLPGWTVHDVLGHVIGTESMLSGNPAPSADVSHLDHMRNPVAEANEVWVESLRLLGGAEMLARFDAVVGRRLGALDAMSQSDFDAPSWTPAGRDETYGRFMRIRHYDCFMHEHDIRFALGAPPREDPDDLRSVLDEVATGLGYIVGRKAAMPDGSRVRIDLTGPIEVTFLVQVDGRAALVESFDRDPTVRIGMPVMLFTRLTGGRDDAGSVTREEIAIAGNRGLARKLVDNLAFTI